MTVMRLSFVTQLSTAVARTTLLCRKADGAALAFNMAQRRWLCEMGVLPLLPHEIKAVTAPAKVMLKACGRLPINNRGDYASEADFVAALKTSCEQAKARWSEFERLADADAAECEEGDDDDDFVGSDGGAESDDNDNGEGSSDGEGEEGGTQDERTARCARRASAKES